MSGLIGLLPSIASLRNLLSWPLLLDRFLRWIWFIQILLGGPEFLKTFPLYVFTHSSIDHDLLQNHYWHSVSKKKMKQRWSSYCWSHYCFPQSSYYCLHLWSWLFRWCWSCPYLGRQNGSCLCYSFGSDSCRYWSFNSSHCHLPRRCNGWLSQHYRSIHRRSSHYGWVRLLRWFDRNLLLLTHSLYLSLFTGVGNGINTATLPTWLGECSRPKNRGKNYFVLQDQFGSWPVLFWLGFLICVECSMIAIGTAISVSYVLFLPSPNQYWSVLLLRQNKIVLDQLRFLLHSIISQLASSYHTSSYIRVHLINHDANDAWMYGCTSRFLFSPASQHQLTLLLIWYSPSMVDLPWSSRGRTKSHCLPRRCSFRFRSHNLEDQSHLRFYGYSTSKEIWFTYQWTHSKFTSNFDRILFSNFPTGSFSFSFFGWNELLIMIWWRE